MATMSIRRKVEFVIIALTLCGTMAALLIIDPSIPVRKQDAIADSRR